MKDGPRIKIKDLPKGKIISRKEMQKIAGGEVFVKTRLKPEPSDSSLILLDLFAASADLMSAYQDAVANEAFLGTARQGTSRDARKRRRD